MNPKIQEYIQRFAPNGFEKPNWPNFFTQLEITDYHQILPYIFGIELFNFRLLQALISKDKICIYSDYDTDAVTATATMFHGLIELGFEPENISFYAPDRFTEGYGMNPEAIRDLAQNYNLIISVDCGINSRAEADLVNQLKSDNTNDSKVIADLIITDHHQLVGSIPEAMAVINPRLNALYASDPELNNILKDRIQKSKNDLFGWLKLNQTKLAERSTILNPSGLDIQILEDKIQSWVEKVEHNPKSFSPKSPSFLTSSATGVGVAWFCLVWLAYFIEEIGLA